MLSNKVGLPPTGFAPEIPTELPVVAQEIEFTNVSGSVDWLTITVSDPAKERLLFDEVQRLAEDLRGQGYVQKKWGMKGYEGFIVAGLRWGVREDGNIMMLSGQDAEINWLPALALAENVTRLDLAATLTLADPLPNVAMRAYSRIITDPNKCVGKKRRYSYVENSAGGQTCYIGSRASDQFGRIYDKGCESKELACAPPGVIWRYEIEFKSYRAKKLARQMEAAAKREETSVGQDIQDLVHKWFLGRGVSPIWVSTNDALDWTLELEARITDDDVSLRWLTIQVRPTVERLMDRRQANEVLEALGISILTLEDAKDGRNLRD